MIRAGNYRIGIECGQRIYRPHSWRSTWKGIRRFPTGFALGPIMIWKENTK